MRAQAGWAIYQAQDGTYEADVDQGPEMYRRRSCGVVSAQAAATLALEWNMDVAMAREIRNRRMDALCREGRDAPTRVEVVTAPRTTPKLGLVDGGS